MSNPLPKIDWDQRDYLTDIEAVITSSDTLVGKVTSIYNFVVTHEDKQSFDDKHIVTYIKWLMMQPHEYRKFLQVDDPDTFSVRKIQLIKHIRTAFNVGLREAKDAVEKVVPPGTPL